MALFNKVVNKAEETAEEVTETVEEVVDTVKPERPEPPKDADGNPIAPPEFKGERPEFKGERPEPPMGHRPPNGEVDVETIAKEVIAGKWGNGDERKEKLTAAGYDYATIQAKVNELMG